MSLTTIEKLESIRDFITSKAKTLSEEHQEWMHVLVDDLTDLINEIDFPDY